MTAQVSLVDSLFNARLKIPPESRILGANPLVRKIAMKQITSLRNQWFAILVSQDFVALKVSWTGENWAEKPRRQVIPSHVVRCKNEERIASGSQPPFGYEQISQCPRTVVTIVLG
jgi:hypothetical protein